ncbi:hypothetical protein HYU12_04875 [Candidatus Woesearchaeota archaeon]|nr:hypothetical protein [Candidatus Woesearchaeota archaeon]
MANDYELIVRRYVTPLAGKIENLSDGENPGTSYAFVNDPQIMRTVVKVIIGQSNNRIPVNIYYGASDALPGGWITASVNGGKYSGYSLERLAEEALKEWQRKSHITKPIDAREKSTVTPRQPTHLITEYT